MKRAAWCSVTSSVGYADRLSTGGSRLGSAFYAVTAVAERDFGQMKVALRGKDIVRVPLAEGTGALKLVSPEEYAVEAQVFFG